jgi:hypothetical protein
VLAWIIHDYSTVRQTNKVSRPAKSGTPRENPAFPALALARERSLRAVPGYFHPPLRGWIFIITARFAKKAVNQTVISAIFVSTLCHF